MWTREDIESTPLMERPKVRCKIDRTNIDQDGRRHTGYHQQFTAEIVVDGNNPWLVSNVASKQRAYRIGWSLCCEVLNNPHAPPVYFDGEAEYEI